MRPLLISFSIFVLSSICLDLFALNKSASLGLGFFSPYVNELSGDNTSDTTLFAEAYYPISYKNFANWFGYEVLWKTSLVGLIPAVKDEDASVDFYQLQFSASRLLSESGDSAWFYGMGISWEILQGNGGSVVLNNGSGYSTFDRPDGSSTSSLFYLEFGYVYDIGSMRLDTSLQMDNPLGDKRSYSFLLDFMFPLSGFSSGG